MTHPVADQLANKARKKTATRQVRLRLVYVDFWSAVKFSFLVALCAGIAFAVAMILIYTVLVSTGVLSKLDTVFMDIVSDQLSLMDMLSFTSVMSFAIVVGILNVIVGTAFGTVGAMIYNLLVRVLGGFLLGFTSN